MILSNFRTPEGYYGRFDQHEMLDCVYQESWPTWKDTKINVAKINLRIVGEKKPKGVDSKEHPVVGPW